MALIKTPPATGCITATTGSIGDYALGAALTMDGDTLSTWSQAVSNGWIADGDLVFYGCKNASGDKEFGIGTYHHAAQTITRTQVLKSTNANAAVVWAAGDKSLYSTFPPEQILLSANNLADLANVATARTSLGATAAGSALFTGADAAAQRASMLAERRFADGTKLLFFQAAAPTGYTQDTSQNDKVLRVVSGAGAGTGGGWTITGLAVQDHTLTVLEMPQHNHGPEGVFTHYVMYGANGGLSVGAGTAGGIDAITGFAGGGQPHGHSLTADGNWRPAYINVIVCTKASN